MINLKTLTAQQLSELIIDATAELSIRAMSKDEVTTVAESFLQEEIDRIANTFHGNVKVGDGKADFSPRSVGEDLYYDRVDFVVNKEKRKVVALLKLVHPRGCRKDFVWKRGIAKCNPEDEFNETVGKYIALHRALDLELPIQF